MPEGFAPLAVWRFDRQAGTRTQSAKGMEFAYAADWVADETLSQSLPLDGRFDAAAADAFFGGLLPEGEPRRQLARLLGVSEGNDYSMLAMIAGDTAGAIHPTAGGRSARADRRGCRVARRRWSCGASNRAAVASDARRRGWRVPAVTRGR
jgi:HipA-like protein